ncbi:MAG: LPS export ABC transporter permease LptG [Deltaproteobacteria bacterium]|nr:LPS export ABC transporter permease LptG [Deltaproteobacteria bacterium]
METAPYLRPRILQAYLAREFAKLLSFSLIAFVSLFVIVDFFERIDRLVRAELGMLDFLRYVSFKVPFAVSQVLPAAVMLGIMLALGIMSRRHETMAIRTSGLDILRLSRSVYLITAGVAVTVLALNFYLVPWSQGGLAFFWQTKINKRPPPSLHKMQHFWYKGDQAIYNIVLFQKDIQTMEGVKIYLFDRSFQLVQIISAARAQWQGGHWRFYQGMIHTFSTGGEETGERFQERDIVLTERPGDFAELEKKVTEMDVGELYRYVQRLERDGYKSTPYRLDLYNRLSQAFAPFILITLGLALALRHEDIHISAMVAMGVALMFVYWLFYGFCLSFGQAGHLPMAVAVILPHLVFGGLAVKMVRRITK